MNTGLQTEKYITVAVLLFLFAMANYNVWFTFSTERLLRQIGAEVSLLQKKVVQLEEALKESNEQSSLESTINKDPITLKNSAVGEVYYHGCRNGKMVAITIDDGWWPDQVIIALDYLKAMEVKATLFPAGISVKENPELWRRAVEEGHELGNHTYSHRYLTSMPEEQIPLELVLWNETVNDALGYPYEAVYFRPPGMAGFSQEDQEADYYRRILAEQNMVVILWDIETSYTLYSPNGPRRIDSDFSPERVASYVTDNVRGGSIILLHFNTFDVEALPLIIKGIRQKGFEPVTITELLFTSRSPERVFNN